MSSGTCLGCGAPLPERARKWCSGRCRKRSYGQACVDCGTRTVHGAEKRRVAEPRCFACGRAHLKVWTRDRILDAIRRWNAIYGEPPAMADWHPWAARHEYHDEARARRYERQRDLWPSFKRAVEEFGSWNAAIVAAGFTARAPHGGSGNSLRQRRFAA